MRKKALAMLLLHGVVAQAAGLDSMLDWSSVDSLSRTSERIVRELRPEQLELWDVYRAHIRHAMALVHHRQPQPLQFVKTHTVRDVLLLGLGSDQQACKQDLSVMTSLKAGALYLTSIAIGADGQQCNAKFKFVNRSSYPVSSVLFSGSSVLRGFQSSVAYWELGVGTGTDYVQPGRSIDLESQCRIELVEGEDLRRVQGVAKTDLSVYGVTAQFPEEGVKRILVFANEPSRRTSCADYDRLLDLARRP